MLINFFYHLRAARLPVSAKELLTLLEALKKDVIQPSIDEFYFLSRATLVKDESLYDRYDRAFGEYFNGMQTTLDLDKEIPEDWFKQLLEREFTAEELAKLEKLGFDKLMEEVPQAPRRTGRRPPRRQQMDRLGRHVAVRPWR